MREALITDDFAEEAELVAGLRRGSADTLEELYKKHYPFVLKFIVANRGTEDAARDIFQETVIVLYENAQEPGFELKCRVRTYLYSVARKLWLKELRNTGRTTLFKEEEDFQAEVEQDLRTHFEKEDEFQKMQSSLASLGEPCASLIRLFYVDRLNMDEIAARFGYTNADNAKNQKYKCLQRLKKIFFNTVEVIK
jgi:RNA polymerase sigma factor (sigma-70 family)